MTVRRPSWRRRARGVSLIEVLIAIVVCAIGLLGVAALQSTALQNNYLSVQFTQAALLAQNLSESMRANRAAVLAGDYHYDPEDDPPTVAADCDKEPCSAAELAAWHLARTLGQLELPGAAVVAPVVLPNGSFSVSCADAVCDDASARVITVYWDSERNGAAARDCDPASSGSLRCFRLIHVP